MMKKITKKLPILALMLGLISSSAFGQIATPPTIDGVGTDAVWAGVATWDLLRDYPEMYHGVTDGADLSGTVKALWDDTTLYVLLEVLDDSLYIGAANSWERDHYTIYFDLSNLKTPAYVADTDTDMDSVQFNVEKPWSEPQGFDWEGDTLAQGIDFVEVIGETGYTAEYAFPLQRIGASLTADQIVGFDVKIGDNDGDGRDGMLSLYQVADEGWHYPNYLGTAKLEADGSFSKVMHSPVIDGVADYPWLVAKEYKLEVDYPDLYDGITSAADFSGTFKVMHNNDNVFVLLNVKDDSLYVGAANSWERDHYTIYFDVSNLKTHEYVTDQDAILDSVQFNVEKPWSEPQGFSWEGDTLVNGVDFVEVIGETGYTVEYVFPFERLGVSIADGANIGFDVKIGDNDGDGRDGMYSWHQSADESWHYPSYMGNLILEPVFVDLGTTSKGPAQIEIDGVIDGDWEHAISMPLLREYPDLYQGVTGPADFSGKVKALWEPGTLYVLLEVTDDSLYIGAANSWERDHYTIYFDQSNLKTATYVEDADMDMDSVQFNVEKPWSEPQGFNWEGDTLVQGVDFVEVINSGTGYVAEYAFPLDRIGVTLVALQDIGFDAKIGDNDGDGRDGMFSWNQLADEGWRYPSYFGTVKLMGNGTIFGTPVIAPEDVTFNVDMNGMIDAGIFDPDVDAVDIAGTMNEWGVTVMTGTDGDADGIYTYVLAAQEVETVIEYKWRVNESWDPISEFPGGGPNRTWTVVEGGPNIVNDVFNNGDYTPWLDAVEIAKANQFALYPNPATSSFTISSADEILSVSITTITGKLLFSAPVDGFYTDMNVSSLDAGLYIVSVHFKSEAITNKMFVKQ